MIDQCRPAVAAGSGSRWAHAACCCHHCASGLRVRSPLCCCRAARRRLPHPQQPCCRPQPARRQRPRRAAPAAPRVCDLRHRGRRGGACSRHGHRKAAGDLPQGGVGWRGQALCAQGRYGAACRSSACTHCSIMLHPHSHLFRPAVSARTPSSSDPPAKLTPGLQADALPGGHHPPQLCPERGRDARGVDAAAQAQLHRRAARPLPSWCGRAGWCAMGGG